MQSISYILLFLFFKYPNEIKFIIENSTTLIFTQHVPDLLSPSYETVLKAGNILIYCPRTIVCYKNNLVDGVVIDRVHH